VKAALLEHRRGLRLHDLRHTYVSLLSSNGAHINVIAEHGGDSTAATMDAYRHPITTSTTASCRVGTTSQGHG
jgi:integrase